MFNFPNRKTPVLFQGITSEMGLKQLQESLTYGTNVVAGISNQTRHKNLVGIPIFQKVSQAVRKYHPKISVVFSTPAHALKDVTEAIKSKIPVIICTTEHIPMHDALKMCELAHKNNVLLIGPSSNGILCVDEVLVGSLPTHLFMKGNIAVIGRSGSLIFEAVQQLKEYRLGFSKCITLGTDHLIATDFIPLVEGLIQDRQTKAILIIGQVHGHLEQDLTTYLKNIKTNKKIFVYIPGKTLLRSDKHPLLGMQSVLFKDIIEQKRQCFESVNAVWIDSVEKIGITLRTRMKK